MRRSIITVLALALSALLAVIGLTAPAGADVTATQQVKIRDESPESGLHKLSFRNYGEKTLCEGSRKYGTYWCAHRVTKGNVATKLSTYKLVEGRDYDYYLVDVDMTVNRSGSSHWGWAHAILTTRTGTKLVDTRETAGISATQGDCRSLDLKLTSPWPVVSGSVGLGSVKFCDDEATFSRHKRSGRTTEYKANRVGRTNHLSTQRWVKVPEGQKPRFKLRLELPKDTCTNYRESRCTSYTNGSVAKTYYVGTKL